MTTTHQKPKLTRAQRAEAKAKEEARRQAAYELSMRGKAAWREMQARLKNNNESKGT